MAWEPSGRQARQIFSRVRVAPRKVDDEAQPTKERHIEDLAQVRGKDSQPPEHLHSLQQVSDFDVGVAVVWQALSTLGYDKLDVGSQK